MSDTTQRLCRNHIVRFRSFLVYILYGLHLWCAACNSVNRTCSTSTLLEIDFDIRNGRNRSRDYRPKDAFAPMRLRSESGKLPNVLRVFEQQQTSILVILLKCLFQSICCNIPQHLTELPSWCVARPTFK